VIITDPPASEATHAQPKKKSITSNQARFQKHLNEEQLRTDDSFSLYALITKIPPPKSVRDLPGLQTPKLIQAYFRERLVKAIWIQFEASDACDSLGQQWALGLLGFSAMPTKTKKKVADDGKALDMPGAIEVGREQNNPEIYNVLPDRSVEEIEHLKQFFIGYVNILLADIPKDESALYWLFNLADDWRSSFEEQTHFGFTIPAALCVTIPEHNVYTKEDTQSYLHLTTLLNGFSQGLIYCNPKDLSMAEEHFGAYLFFVVCLSGITNWKLLGQIATLSLQRRALDEPYSSLLLPRSTNDPADLAYRDLFATKDQGIYRWIPDPLSAKLLQLIVKSNSLPALKTDLFKSYLQPFFNRLREQLGNEQARQESKKVTIKSHQIIQEIQDTRAALDFFSSKTRLIKSSRAFQRRTLPAFLWHYLEGDYETHDIPSRNLERLGSISIAKDSARKLTSKESKQSRQGDSGNATDKDIEPASLEDIADLEAQQETDKEFEEQNIADTAPRIRWVTDCIHILDTYRQTQKPKKSKSVNQPKDSSSEDLINCQQQLADLRAQSGLEDATIIEVLTNWIIWSIEQHPLYVVQDEVRLLCPLLIVQYGLFSDFFDMDAQERADEFDILETESGYGFEDCKIVRSAWKHLHQHLISAGKILTNQYRGPGSSVDAQFISQTEFELIRFQLCYAGSSPDKPTSTLRNICLLVITLAYRLGLRRSEVILLATEHVSIFDEKIDMLSVQWWSQRRLKSPSSTRTIPLLGLLDEQEGLWLELMLAARQKGLWPSEYIINLSNVELKKLIAHYRRIKTNEMDSGRYLFINPAEGSVENSVENIVSQIHEAIRAVTAQDKQLRFHHLRHSCASNCLIFLLANRLPHSQRFILDLLYGNPEARRRLDCMAKTGLRVNNYFDPDLQIKILSERSEKIRKYLLNDPRASISEVYAVSRLLGHSSPITTLKSYMHLVHVLLGAFFHERFIDLPISLRSAIYPYGPQYLEALIEQTDLKITIPTSTAPITLLEIKKTGKHSVSAEELTLLEIIDKHQTEGLLLILELLQTRFSKAASNPKRYFEKAAIAGISKLLASKLADQFETVMDMYLKAKKGRTNTPLPLDFEDNEMAMFKTPLLEQQALEWSRILIRWYQDHPKIARELLTHYVGQASRSKPNLIRLTPIELSATQIQNQPPKNAGSQESNPTADLRRYRRNYKDLMDLLGIGWKFDGDTIRPKISNDVADQLIDKNGVWGVLRKLLFLMAAVTPNEAHQN